jgi:hypothetical protein
MTSNPSKGAALTDDEPTVELIKGSDVTPRPNLADRLLDELRNSLEAWVLRRVRRQHARQRNRPGRAARGNRLPD